MWGSSIDKLVGVTIDREGETDLRKKKNRKNYVHLTVQAV